MKRLFSAITRYNGVLDTAREFVRAIVDPPLELVFHETKKFLEDWQACSPEEQSHFASELNDCCQFLLYDDAEFNRVTEKIRPALSGGVEASLRLMNIDESRILFSIDEDPVFGQLIVTLYRVVAERLFDEACKSTIESLYHELT